MFENLCTRDISVYIENRGGNIKHYRECYGVDCDTIVNFAMVDMA